MDNVTVESLEKKFPGEGRQRFEAIRDKGGFGVVPPDYSGGLDVGGVVAGNNLVFSDKQKSELADLAGMSKADRERIDSNIVPTEVVTRAAKEKKD